MELENAGLEKRAELKGGVEESGEVACGSAVENVEF